MFTEDEKETLFRVAILAGAPGRTAYVLRIAEETARVLAARGGTMTAEEIQDLGQRIRNVRFNVSEVEALYAHAFALGATVASLQTENARLKSIIAPLEERKKIDTAHIETVEQEKATLQAKVEELGGQLSDTRAAWSAESLRADGLRAEVGGLEKEVERLNGEAWQAAVMISGMVEQVDALHGGARRIMAERDRAEDVSRHLAQQTVHQEQEVTLLARECGARDDKAREIQRAREVAEKERDALRAEVEKLKADLEDTKDRLRIAAMDSELAESRLAAIREALDAIRDGRIFRGEYTPEAIAKAALWPEGDAPQEGKGCDCRTKNIACIHWARGDTDAS